jgi:enoyl-CoA hydratase/carnithine racemase
LVKTANPVGKVDTLPYEALKEMRETLEVVREDQSLAFVIFYGGETKVHAGADLAMFAGEIDFRAVHEYLLAGAEIDMLVKSLGKRTVSIIQGDCYGGSVEWPLMAESSICTNDASIQFSEVNIGIIPGWSGILNVLLRSNKENALCLAATGRKINAQEMLSAGLVSRVCSAEDMMDIALDLVTTDAMDNPVINSFSTLGEINKIIDSRTDVGRYRALYNEVSKRIANGELIEDRHADNYAGKYIMMKLNESGRPLAPLAVKTVFDLVEKYSNVKSADKVLAGEMAREEADLCFALMKTVDRRTGVNSIVSANSLDKIPVYIGE